MSNDKIQRSRWTPDTDLPVNEFILEAQTHFRSSEAEERIGIVILEPQIALNDSIIGFNSDKEVLIYSVTHFLFSEAEQQIQMLEDRESFPDFLVDLFEIISIGDTVSF